MCGNPEAVTITVRAFASTTKPCRKPRKEIMNDLYRNFKLHEGKDEYCNCTSHTNLCIQGSRPTSRVGAGLSQFYHQVGKKRVSKLKKRFQAENNCKFVSTERFNSRGPEILMRKFRQFQFGRPFGYRAIWLTTSPVMLSECERILLKLLAVFQSAPFWNTY